MTAIKYREHSQMLSELCLVRGDRFLELGQGLTHAL